MWLLVGVNNLKKGNVGVQHQPGQWRLNMGGNGPEKPSPSDVQEQLKMTKAWS